MPADELLILITLENRFPVGESTRSRAADSSTSEGKHSYIPVHPAPHAPRAYGPARTLSHVLLTLILTTCLSRTYTSSNCGPPPHILTCLALRPTTCPHLRFLLENCKPDLEFINKMVDNTALARLEQVRGCTGP